MVRLIARDGILERYLLESHSGMERVESSSDRSLQVGQPHKAAGNPSDVGCMRLTEEVSFEDFKRLDVRVGVITSVERVRRTEKLYKILVDLGALGTRQTVSSLVGYYEPNELVGKRIVFLTNLKQTKFAGEVSQGMLLAAELDGKLALLTTDREIQSGARIT
jgi:methionine--tRNA ligase beta chain